jgi:hypothetical protein
VTSRVSSKRVKDKGRPLASFDLTFLDGLGASCRDCTAGELRGDMDISSFSSSAFLFRLLVIVL